MLILRRSKEFPKNQRMVAGVCFLPSIPLASADTKDMYFSDEVGSAKLHHASHCAFFCEGNFKVLSSGNLF